MKLTEKWINTALKITGHFEDSEDPFGGVSGNFDGMGISLGVLQWNIGCGSLQPLVKNIGKKVVIDAMPIFGNEFWTACSSSISQGLKIVQAWQTGTKLPSNVRAELKALAHSDAFVKEQIKAATHVAQLSLNAAVAWNKDKGADNPDVREFCWFFDVITQNGGLKGLSYNDVKNYISNSGTELADDLVCEWLADRTPRDNGFKDSLKNSALWLNSVPEDRLVLFVASFLRSKKSNPAWQADVLNRKGTIAFGRGWVHGEKHNLNPLFDILW